MVFDDKCDEQLDCNRLIFSSMTESSNFYQYFSAIFLVTNIQSLPQSGPYWPNIEIAVMGFPNDARDTDIIAINLKPLLSEAVWSGTSLRFISRKNHFIGGIQGIYFSGRKFVGENAIDFK